MNSYIKIMCMNIPSFFYLPQTVMKIDQRTVAALSKRYAIFELKQDLDSFQKSQ